ncbi:hypothetical protein C8Q75DRAFT_808077 [Abortiporus biennis]|nr:hypothetical protein C8Q75DRAFT_808077 [Abortiporus biennis]
MVAAATSFTASAFRSASTFVRRVTSTPSQSLYRTSRAASTLSYPSSDNSTIGNIQIFDIFDAPSRLGESSKLLTLSISCQNSPIYPSPSSPPHSSSPKKINSRHIEPLPPPIIFDGPARLKFSGYRSSRTMSSSARVSKEPVQFFDGPYTLPPPDIYDGPSQLRPYGGYASTSSSGLARDTMTTTQSTTALMILGCSVLAILTGYQYHGITRKKTRDLDQESKENITLDGVSGGHVKQWEE